MSGSQKSDIQPSISEFLEKVDYFLDRYKLDSRTRNLLRLSMPAHQAWELLSKYEDNHLDRARNPGSMVRSDVRKYGFRSDVNTRNRLFAILERSRGALTRDDKREIDDASIVQIQNLLEDLNDKYKLDERAEDILKVKTPLNKTVQLLISALSDGTLAKAKNPSSAIMGQLKLMHSRKPADHYVEDSKPTKRVRRVSHSPSPRRDAYVFPKVSIPRHEVHHEQSRRLPIHHEQVRSVEEVPRREAAPHNVELPPARSVELPQVLSIERALVLIDDWSHRNGVTSRTRHDMLHRLPYDAVLRGISSYPTDKTLGEALIRSLEQDPSCQGMPSVESLAKEAEDYVQTVGGHLEILNAIKQRIFIRDADSMVAGQLPTLKQEVVTAIHPIQDRSWFLLSAVQALSEGRALPMPPGPPPTSSVRFVPTNSLPSTTMAHPVQYPPPAPNKYLGGIMIGAPSGTEPKFQQPYRGDANGYSRRR